MKKEESSAPESRCYFIYRLEKDGKYVFENATLEEIMQVLSRWYDIAVFYKREEVKKLHFTGDLERYKTINDFLEFMEIGGNVRFSIKRQDCFDRIKNRGADVSANLHPHPSS